MFKMRLFQLFARPSCIVIHRFCCPFGNSPEMAESHQFAIAHMLFSLAAILSIFIYKTLRAGANRWTPRRIVIARSGGWALLGNGGFNRESVRPIHHQGLPPSVGCASLDDPLTWLYTLYKLVALLPGNKWAKMVTSTMNGMYATRGEPDRCDSGTSTSSHPEVIEKRRLGLIEWWNVYRQG